MRKVRRGYTRICSILLLVLLEVEQDIVNQELMATPVLKTHMFRHTDKLLAIPSPTTSEEKLSKTIGPSNSTRINSEKRPSKSTEPVPRYPLWLSPM